MTTTINEITLNLFTIFHNRERDGPLTRRRTQDIITYNIDNMRTDEIKIIIKDPAVTLNEEQINKLAGSDDTQVLRSLYKHRLNELTKNLEAASTLADSTYIDKETYNNVMNNDMLKISNETLANIIIAGDLYDQIDLINSGRFEKMDNDTPITERDNQIYDKQRLEAILYGDWLDYADTEDDQSHGSDAHRFKMALKNMEDRVYGQVNQYDSD